MEKKNNLYIIYSTYNTWFDVKYVISSGAGPGPEPNFTSQSQIIDLDLESIISWVQKGSVPRFLGSSPLANWVCWRSINIPSINRQLKSLFCARKARFDMGTCFIFQAFHSIWSARTEVVFSCRKLKMVLWQKRQNWLKEMDHQKEGIW